VIVDPFQRALLPNNGTCRLKFLIDMKHTKLRNANRNISAPQTFLAALATLDSSSICLTCAISAGGRSGNNPVGLGYFDQGTDVDFRGASDFQRNLPMPLMAISLNVVLLEI
jgi:hypothetical protein